MSTDGPPFVTKTGRVLTDDDIQALADEAEAGYDVSKLKPRQSGYHVRPRWTEAVRHFINDEVLDEKYGYPQEGGDDWLHSLVEDAVNNIFCNAFGHDIVDDQCMIPEHRYCLYCGRRVGVL